MVLDREVEGARRAPAVLLDVVGLAAAQRHVLARQVGHAQADHVDRQADLLQALFTARQFFGERRDLSLEHFDLGLARLGLRGIAGAETRDLPHQRADLLRLRIAQALQLLRARLDLLALGLQGLQALDVELEAAGALQALGSVEQVGAQQLGVEHGSSRGSGTMKDPRLSARRARCRNAAAVDQVIGRASGPRSRQSLPASSGADLVALGCRCSGKSAKPDCARAAKLRAPPCAHPSQSATRPFHGR